MIDRLPAYYSKSKTLKDFYNVVQTILDKVSEDISDEDKRLFITTTDSFLLHEKDVGLSEITADNETKRARVIARLQGNNLLTKSELEQLILMYDRTGCIITEDYKNYTVAVKFSGRKGVPYNFEQIKSAVDEVKPAHLQVNYEFQSNTWSEVQKKLGTWGNAKIFTWGGVKDYDGRTWLYVENNEVYLRENGANAYVVFKDNKPYAHFL